MRARPPGLILAGVVLCAAATGWSQTPADGLSAAARSQLEAAERAASRLGTRRAALAAGYRRLVPRAIGSDVNPVVGEHWINERHLRMAELDPARPAFLMFYPLPGGERLVGVAYAMTQLSGAAAPEGFDGPSDVWHVHHPCAGVPELGFTLAHGAEDCAALGGTPGEAQMAMVHVWLEPPNPAGPFAPDHPGLPFVATGLRPPSAEALADPVRARRARTLGLALGESFGALPRLGAQVEHDPALGFPDRVAADREAIRMSVDAMRTAERHGDHTRYAAAADRAIAHWDRIRRAYLDAAPSPALRLLLERWFAAAAGEDPHHLTH